MTKNSGPVIRAPAFYNDGSRYLTRVVQPINLVDDQHLAFGADKDVVALLKSGTHSANSPLADVFIGTPVTPALPVNTFILSNVTASGDLLWAVNKGGHSQAVFWADGSTGNTAVMAASGASVDTYIGGTKEIDYAAGAMAFQQATTISAAGDLTLDSSASLNVTLTDTAAIALSFANSAVTYYRIDTRTTNPGTIGHAWDMEDATLASAPGAHYSLATFSDYTINYEGNTTVTTQVRAILFGSLTIAADGVGGVLTVNRATTFMLGAPVEGENVSLINTYAIRITNTFGSPTVQTGIYVDALAAGGTNIGLSTENDIDLRSAGTLLNIGASGNDLLAGTITWVSASDTAGTFTFTTYSITASTRSEFILERSNHNTVGTHGAVEADDVLGALMFKGSDGDSFETGALMRAVPTETFAAGARGTKLEFYTVGNTTTSLGLRLTIDQDGTVIVGGIVSVDNTTNSTSGTTGSIHTDGGLGIVENLYCAKAINTPDGMGGDGEQLTSGGDNTAMDWAAAGSLLEFKNVHGMLAPQDALDRILDTRVVLFSYRSETSDGKHAITTGDYKTEYAGVLGDEAPWAMHHGGRIFSPVSAFGYTVAAFHAVDTRLVEHETRFSTVEDRLGVVEAAEKIVSLEAEVARLRELVEA